MHIFRLILFHILFIVCRRIYSMPPQQSSCRRRNSRSASKSADSQLEAQATTKSAKDARRRRLELRRMRSFSQEMSASPDGIMKDETEQGASDFGGGRLCVRRRSYGKISVVGRQREMDDVVVVELGFVKRGEEIYDFYGVFDGRAACSRMLAKIVEEERDWEEVILEGFDAKISKNGAVVAVVGENEVVVGGLKAVLCRSGGVAVRLLDDDEIQVTKRRRADYDEFLILGSHGFWEVVSDELACQIASAEADVEAAAALMAKSALAKGSRHNITVILVDLRAANY